MTFGMTSPSNEAIESGETGIWCQETKYCSLKLEMTKVAGMLTLLEEKILLRVASLTCPRHWSFPESHISFLHSVATNCYYTCSDVKQQNVNRNVKPFHLHQLI